MARSRRSEHVIFSGGDLPGAPTLYQSTSLPVYKKTTKVMDGRTHAEDTCKIRFGPGICNESRSRGEGERA